MPRLNATPFTDELLPLVSDFDCGPLKYQHEVADWIRGQSPGTVLDAIHSRRRPTLVWLYSTPQDGVVGYGSLSRSAWASNPGGPRDMPISLIPNLGLDSRFHGCPPDAESDDRYSSQIIGHLKREARQYPPEDRLPLLGLFVHPENARGRKFYERMGFTNFPQTYTDDDGVIYQGMILKLAPADTDRDTSEEESMVSQQVPSTGTSAPAPASGSSFEEAVPTVLSAPPTPEQQAKTAARKARAEERRKKPKHHR